MIKKTTFQRDQARNYQGTRDYFGDDARWRQQVRDTIQSAFELFGFEPLETPAFETISTLKGKGGEEADAKFFHLSLPFPKDGGLRFDFTVPLARFTAMNWNKFPLPYRRYAIGPVWRNDATQAGRYKEFWQCDFDTVGSTSPVIDAEIVAMKYSVFTQLGFPEGSFQIQVNSRQLLNALARSIEVTDPEQIMTIFKVWDKLGKTNRSQIRQELKESGLSTTLIKDFDKLTDKLQSVIMTSQLSNQSVEIDQALQELQVLFDSIDAMSIPAWAYRFNPLLARGLSYYTGPIFETWAGDKGSISGGGRFDQLIEALGGPDMPASGASFGLERVMTVMEELGLKPKSSQTTQVLVTLFDPNNQDLCQASFKLTSQLRAHGLNVEVYTGEHPKLGKQLDVARRKSISLVIIIGPDELAQNKVVIKNLVSGEQQLVNASKVVSQIKKILK
jgi:histidyl-tRNA synthetase